MTQKFTNNARSLLVGGVSAALAILLCLGTAKASQKSATQAQAYENLVGEP